MEEQRVLDIVTQVNVTRRQCEIVRVQTRSPVVRRTGDVLGATRRSAAVQRAALDTQLCS